jgi:adenosylcobinamide kinase/adenosylcobinamide-phosphate guanylyltransferase
MVTAMHELILGGVRSGKSRAAEARAARWLAGAGPDAGRDALLIATALPADAEMRARIDRHRAGRAARLPALRTLEAAHGLAAVIGAQSQPARLLVVDCLTLWLTQLLLPPAAALEAADAAMAADLADPAAAVQRLLAAIDAAAGPLVLVANEVGLGVLPVEPAARRCVDALGELQREVAARCARVTLIVAGRELALPPPAGGAR